ncbi:MarR family winged helix-turn-helix transcriptional regulator [Candidatus Babeliales bacterium]|nr:MarR family winged helix-turn-helix transcriptional regulator [Candidatus Babeliales bacterium]
MTKSPFGFKKPEDSPGFLLWQTTIIWQRRINKALDEYGVSHAQFVIMALLLWFQENNYESNQALIADKSKLDKMTVSKALKKLVELGFVQRTEDTRDTRAKVAQLTEKGKTMVKVLVPIVEGIDKKFFGNVSVFDQQQLIKILGALLEKIRD